MVVEISLTKNVERKKMEQTGKNKQEKAHFQSHDKLVVVSLYTKFKVSIVNGCGDIFDEKSGEKEKRINLGKNK